MADALDAAQLRQLTAHFDALPGDAPAVDAAAAAIGPAAPAANTALAARLARDGRFCPAPPEPPWTDPRPDLAGDHGRWTVLLALAWALDGADPHGVFGALHGIRCGGAALVTDAQPRDLAHDGPPLRWRLTRGELPEPEWQAYRARWLWPHKDVLTKLLRGGSKA